MNHIAFARSGTGEPMVLLHGLGLSRRSWEPIGPQLARRFDVLAVDLPGFGESAPLPDGVEPTPAALAMSVAGLLDDLGINRPHLVGNSLGGWVALELAAIRPASSITLLSPAGLWRDRTPRYDRISLSVSRFLARYLGGLISGLVRFRLGRLLVLAQSHGRPARMSADEARVSVRAMGRCAGFDATLAATRNRRYVSGPPLDAPISLAFGSRDRILLRRQSRHLDQLPAGTAIESLLLCGHVPMYDDPSAVAAFITASTAKSPTALATARLRVV